MIFDIITIFPNFFNSFVKEALVARAIKKKIIDIRAHNLRQWTFDNHKTVDGRPYGGGAGMVLMVEPILKAVNTLRNSKFQIPNSKTGKRKSRVILFSAKGKTFNQAAARRLSKFDQLIFICGRYEGIDERVVKYVADEEVSIGDYVLFGGEVPAMTVIEAVTRLLPGAVGKQKSLDDESFNPHPSFSRKRERGKGERGMEKKMMTTFLEYPHFTRPETVVISGRKRAVPKVLLSGNHEKIETWRKKQSWSATKKRQKLLK